MMSKCSINPKDSGEISQFNSNSQSNRREQLRNHNKAQTMFQLLGICCACSHFIIVYRHVKVECGENTLNIFVLL